MKKLTIGILAHVDAGKTTLSESILYLTGKIRKLGRVDHQDAFLDTFALEKSRGITIFSKQAVFELVDASGKEPMKVTLQDTPGHVDFSAEMERTLQVLDLAILVINGADGVQGHTRTLLGLLEKYRIPTFLFVNKMDQPQCDREALAKELAVVLGDGFVEFDRMEEEDYFYDAIAMCDEEAMEEYLEEGEVAEERIRKLIAERKVFPCYFGSALKLQGVEELLAGMYRFATPWDERRAKAPFGARVFKISRDAQGNRLTHLKITGGSLKVKDELGNDRDALDHWQEKVNQIRIYSGDKFESVQEAPAGTICQVTGLSFTFPGEGLGSEKQSEKPVLEPVLNYCVLLPEGYDAHTMLKNLRQLEEEDPLLRVVWNEELQEIHVQLMGEVQIEILRSLIEERFGVRVTFDTGNIVYKETILSTVEGVGHFEPLRHYAEVHLILEPGKRGSGIVLKTACSEDVLDKNWQRLILTHLMERVHRGVLIGAQLTDVVITLAAGRAHIKHTEGGDFRQATYRAVRQGLMQAESQLLEPFYEFRLEIPQESVGRAMTDIQKAYGEFTPPVMKGDMAIITGTAPVSELRDYQKEVTAYTHGRGRLFCLAGGYMPCHNQEAVVEAVGYEPERDLENTADSVFCSHGAGVNVHWKEVPEHMHIESQLGRVGSGQSFKGDMGKSTAPVRKAASKAQTAGGYLSHEDAELEEIFIRTYGKVERKKPAAARVVSATKDYKPKKAAEPVDEYLLVDGYNVIFAWEDLKELAHDNIEGARGRLMDILCNYQGFKKCNVILVFDGYKVEGNLMEVYKYHNIHVIYTKEAETADQYIEKVVHQIGRKYHVTVVTSDAVEQVVTRGQGSDLISSREFREEVEIVEAQISEEAKLHTGGTGNKNYLFDHMDEDLRAQMLEYRLGKK